MNHTVKRELGLCCFSQLVDLPSFDIRIRNRSLGQGEKTLNTCLYTINKHPQFFVTFVVDEIISGDIDIVCI